MELRADKLTGPQKAAVLMLTAGQELTEALFKAMDERSIKRIGRYMSEINYIPAEVLSAVMHEYLENIGKEANIVVSGEDFLKEVVNKTLDRETAKEVIKVIGSKSDAVPFSDLAYVPAHNLVNIIQGEHPQTIALILSHLSHEQAAEVLGYFTDEMKVDIAMRILQIDQVDANILREVDEAIKTEIKKVAGSSSRINGIETLANILNNVDRSAETTILSSIEEGDADLAEKVRQKMFLFEDLLSVEDRHFRSILQSVDNQMLARALRTTTEEMREKVFKNLSERASEMLREDMEDMGPVKLSDVEEAQQAIIREAKKLEDEGKIVLGKGGEDVFV